MANSLDHEVPMPGVNYNCVNASVMFPRGNTYTRGKVIGRKIYADRNAILRTNNKHILYKREYCIEFDDGMSVNWR